MADQINVNAEDRAVEPQKATEPRWGQRLLTLLIVAAAIGGFSAVVVYSYEKGLSMKTDTAAPIISAQKGPTKMRPQEPGGMSVPNRDKKIYSRLNIAEKSGKIERLLPPPETVVSKPPALSTGTSASNRVAIETQIPEKIAKNSTAIKPTADKPKVFVPPAPPAMRDAQKLTAGKQQLVKAPRTIAKPAKKLREVATLSASAAKQTGRAFRVQLASLRSQKAAENAWVSYIKHHAILFGHLESKIVRVKLKGKGTYYRLQAGPFRNASAARSLCFQAKKRKIGCILVSP
ncbi:SPOR domain-containing protein [Alphaproteobacteria bacterium]|nr:SPOR domain-containing protein [Alphaproteobacteria bacterium]